MFPHQTEYNPANWSQFFLKAILPTTFIPLTPKLTTFLLKDQVILPQGWFDFNNTQYYIPSTNLNEQLPTPIPNHSDYEILSLIITFKQLFIEYGSGIYPKLDHLSPSDALWLMPDHTIKCFIPNDILLLLTGSSKVLDYIKERVQYNNIENQSINTTTTIQDSTSSIAPFSILPSSTNLKPTTIIPNINKSSYKPILYSHSELFIILRKWFSSIHPSESFRICIYNGHILTISQRDGLKYDFTIDKLETIIRSISTFHQNVFIPNWLLYQTFLYNQYNIENNNNNTNTNDEQMNIDQNDIVKQSNINLIYDIYINTKNGAVKILDINPLPTDFQHPIIHSPLSSILPQYPQQQQQQQQQEKLLQHYQSEIILFQPTTIETIATIHTIEPLAMSLLQHSTQQSNQFSKDTITTIINQLTSTYINSTPMIIHIFKLFLNLHYYIQTHIELSNPLVSITHPIYSYLTPFSLPQIPSDKCLNITFNYIYTPYTIPTILQTIWSELANSFQQTTIIENMIELQTLFDPIQSSSLLTTTNTNNNAVDTTILDATTGLPSFSASKQNIIDYTTILPQCQLLFTNIISNLINCEFISLSLLLLQYLFLYQIGLDMNLNKDFALNESLQKISKLKTKVVDLYTNDLLYINQHGIVDIIDTTTQQSTLFFPTNSMEEIIYESNDETTLPLSITSTSPIQLTKIHIPYQSTSKDQIIVTIPIDYPHYIVLDRSNILSTTQSTSSNSLSIDIIDDKIISIQEKSNFTSLIQLLDLLTLTKMPIPFRIVTDYTQQQEDERVTVKQVADRLPAIEDPKYNIDVSSAEGIQSFVELMKQLQGDDDDEDYSDYTSDDE